MLYCAFDDKDGPFMKFVRSTFLYSECGPRLAKTPNFYYIDDELLFIDCNPF